LGIFGIGSLQRGVEIASNDFGNKVFKLFSLEVMLTPYWKEVGKCKNESCERNSGYEMRG
jgi:hypothetical protein